MFQSDIQIFSSYSSIDLFRAEALDWAHLYFHSSLIEAKVIQAMAHFLGLEHNHYMIYSQSIGS